MERANVIDVALALGLQVDRRETEPRKAICPFHDDKDPSLSLYGATAADRSHYHCYVCGAHGDAIKLVQTYENLTFGEAVIRLARILGEEPPAMLAALPDRRTGGIELSRMIQQASPRARRFASYVAERGFDPAWLQGRGVAALSLTPLIEKARQDRVLEEALVAAGIARRRDEGEARELWQEGLRGFFGGERLVFQINDERGVVAGFAARALNDDKPKYLFSYGFPRRDILYRADMVTRRLESELATSRGEPFDLYIVEGLFDALRLEALDFNAVAILGARMTPGQLGVLRSLTREEARAWITDNRAGFGFSGPLADLPTTDAMDPLAEAGDIDRKTALGMLYDPELDDPANSARTLSRIGWALQTPDLRFNDRASAYRRLWTLAASVSSPAARVAADFLALVEEVDPVALLTPDGDARRDVLLACIEGLDRALRFSVPSGTLPASACEEIAARTQRLASAVLEDVFTPLVAAVGELNPGSFLRRYDVRTQIGVIGQLAAETVAANGDVDLSALRTHIDASGKEQPLYGGLLWSLHRYDRRVFGPREIPVTRFNATEVAFTRLHGAIVQLQRLGRLGGQEEELLPLPEAALTDPDPIVSAATQILNIWSPSADGAGILEPTQLNLDAAATLVNLTHGRFAEVAGRRPHLLSMIANHADARPLPSPPGLQAQGLLLWHPDGKLLLARPSDGKDDPVGVQWTPQQSLLGSSIVLKTADLPVGCEPIFTQSQDWSPRRIAETYRTFFPIWRQLTVAARLRLHLPDVGQSADPRRHPARSPSQRRRTVSKLEH